MLKRVAVLAFALLPLAASAQTAVPPPRGVVRYPVKTVTFAAQVRGYADETAALAAMRAAGIDDPVIGPPGSQINNGSQSMLRGTVRDVTRAKLERIALAAADFMRTHPGITMEGVNVFPGADGCSGFEQAAREAAFADARRKAQAIAALAGLTIDGLSLIHISEPTRQAEISYAVFCLKKKKKK